VSKLTYETIYGKILTLKKHTLNTSMSFLYVFLGMLRYLVEILREKNFGTTYILVQWV